jgi:hypothetical protein
MKLDANLQAYIDSLREDGLRPLFATERGEVALNASPGDGVRPMATLELLRTGSFLHPTFGDLRITPKLLDSLAENFDAGVRGVDVALDGDHDPTATGAYGWFKQVTVERDPDTQQAKLMGAVELTPPGEDQIRQRLRPYVSIEFDGMHVDNESGEEHGPTMIGAALTTRPFIKRMEQATLNLSEFAAEAADPVEQEAIVTETAQPTTESEDMADEYTAVGAALGLTDAKPEEMVSEIEAMSDVAALDEAQRDRIANMLGTDTDGIEAGVAALVEQATKADAGKTEAEATVATLAEQVSTLATELQGVQSARAEELRVSLVAAAKDSGKLLPFEAEEGAVMYDLALADPERFSAEMDKRGSVVEFGERGHSTAEPVLDATARLAQAQTAKLAELKTTNPDATMQDVDRALAIEHPELYQAYAEEQRGNVV